MVIKETSLHSTEAEYVALMHTFQEGIWLHFNQLAIEHPSSISIHSDNEGVIVLAANRISHNHTKHININIHFHFICSHINSQYFSLSHIPDCKNPADIFTKPLGPLFEFHQNNLGLLLW